MNKPYEIVVLLHPDLEIDLDKPMKKIESLIKDNGGTITKSDVWGKRRLAYTIAKQDFAVYVYLEVELPPESIGKLENSFNIADEVIRYIVTNPVPKTEDDASAEPADDEKADDKESKKTDEE